VYKKFFTLIQNLVRQQPQRCIMVALGALAVVFMILWGSSSGTIRKYKNFSTQEMEKRLDAEKNRDELQKERDGLAAKVQSLQQGLSEKTEELENAQKDLKQQRLVNKGMQEEMDKLIKSKRELEEQLKKVVLQGKIPDSSKIRK